VSCFENVIVVEFFFQVIKYDCSMKKRGMFSKHTQSALTKEFDMLQVKYISLFYTDY